ncbi:MAG: PEP-CTERM sorting domain-containing protein, partial [Pseudomonadota bacterium]
MNMKSKMLTAGVFALALSTGANAAMVEMAGDGFKISYDDSLVGLFGTPILAGNSIEFAPGGSPGYTAQTDSGVDVTNSTFSMVVTADEGKFLDGFNLSEQGSYFSFGDSAGVDVSGKLTVKPLVPNGPIMSETIASDSSFEGTATPSFEAKEWTSTTGFSDLNLTSAIVSIQSILAAYVVPPVAGASYAFIEKTNSSLLVSAVPEPEVYAMMFAGLGLVGFVARRRMA